MLTPRGRPARRAQTYTYTIIPVRSVHCLSITIYNHNNNKPSRYSRTQGLLHSRYDSSLSSQTTAAQSLATRSRVRSTIPSAGLCSRSPVVVTLTAARYIFVGPHTTSVPETVTDNCWHCWRLLSWVTRLFGVKHYNTIVVYAAMAAGKILVYGGKGALGSTCTSFFTAQKYVSIIKNM